LPVGNRKEQKHLNQLSRICQKFGNLFLILLLTACTTNFELPETTKTGAISRENYADMKGPASLNGFDFGWKNGVPLYSSFSYYRGTKPWMGDPRTKIAYHSVENFEITVLGDNPTQAWTDVAGYFAAKFAESLSSQDKKTWKEGKKRIYQIDLLMFPPGTKIKRKFKQLFFGKSFHAKFYFPFYKATTLYETGEMRFVGSTVAHEFYHLRVSHLGGSNEHPFRKDLTKTQSHILEEAAGRFFGSCIELQTKEQIDFRRGVIHSKIDKSTGEVRVGTLSDEMIKAALAPGTKIHRDDLVAYGPMLFATYWAQHHGTDPIIKKDDETAEKIQDLCDNHIAHPTDLWPIFWEMANDGMDAPEFEQFRQKPAS
jgi:hypothetical protein